MDCNDVRLLYDGHFEEELLSLLVKRKLKHFKKKIIVQDEKCFRGCESDGVVYLGSGHLEAFSRAKLELSIILCCNLSSFKGRYNKYRNALNTASDKIIKRIYLEEQDTLEMENQDDKRLSKWSQWTQEQKLSYKKSKKFDIDVQDCWRNAMEMTDVTKTQNLSEVRRAALLAWEGYITSVKCLNISNLDITDIPVDQMKKLTSIVTERVCIDDITPLSQLGNILTSVKCLVLSLDNMELCEADTRALVTAMRDRVAAVGLCRGLTLNIEELTKYDGQGQCSVLRVMDHHFRSRVWARLKKWAAKIGWTWSWDIDGIDLVMKRESEREDQ